MDAKVLLFVLLIQFVSSAYLNIKKCPNVNPKKCDIHNVKLYPCLDSPAFCVISREEPYTIAFDFTPRLFGLSDIFLQENGVIYLFVNRKNNNITDQKPWNCRIIYFDARNLKVSMLSDPDNSTRFTKTVTPVSDACEYTKCPVENNLRSVFELDFEYYMKSQGQFPLQLRLWHDEDDSETCCFTFNVKMLN